MTFKVSFKNSLHQASQWVQDQEWFQDLKGIWQKLDPQKQFYAQLGLAGISLLFFIGLLLDSVWGVYQLKKEVNHKNQLVQLLENSQAELKRLKASLPRLAQEGNGEAQESWPSYLEQIGQQQGISAPQIQVSQKSKLSAKTGQMDHQEVLFQVQLKKINIKQAVKYAFSVENGSKPAKIRNLQWQRFSDGSGYLDATLTLSTFSPRDPS